jgi:hypothetical protein
MLSKRSRRPRRDPFAHIIRGSIGTVRHRLVWIDIADNGPGFADLSIDVLPDDQQRADSPVWVVDRAEHRRSTRGP